MSPGGSDSGLVTRAAFKAVWLQANTWNGGFDSHPLPPFDPLLMRGYVTLRARLSPNCPFSRFRFVV